MPDLEDRVAALEAALFTPAISPDWTEEQLAEFRKEFAKAAERHEMRLIPPKPPLTPDEIRQLLRECVTVVKPGETLIFRCLEGWTPDQAAEIGRLAAYWLEGNAPHIKALVLPPLEIAVMEREPAEVFAVRVMDAINAMDVRASVYNGAGGEVAARAKFQGGGQWWPSDEARRAARTEKVPGAA